jgi:ATP-binding cassette subfamily A (ABC1) protein 3
MQLDHYVKTKAGNLSGGNKRKLCVADALIGCLFFELIN